MLIADGGFISSSFFFSWNFSMFGSSASVSFSSSFTWSMACMSDSGTLASV